MHGPEVRARRLIYRPTIWQAPVTHRSPPRSVCAKDRYSLVSVACASNPRLGPVSSVRAETMCAVLLVAIRRLDWLKLEACCAVCDSPWTCG